MTESQFADGARLDTVAVFPLPQVVLFPGALMPLHIFEPRYRAMTRDALASTRLLCVAFVAADHGVDDDGQPEIAPIAGVGEIVEHEMLDDGRYNVLVRGCARARVEELPFLPPYRRASLRVIGTHDEGLASTDARALRACATEMAATIRSNHPGFRFTPPAEAHPGRLADLCAHFLVLDGDDRQKLLETLDDGKRVAHCLDVLMAQQGESGFEGTLH